MSVYSQVLENLSGKATRTGSTLNMNDLEGDGGWCGKAAHGHEMKLMKTEPHYPTKDLQDINNEELNTTTTLKK